VGGADEWTRGADGRSRTDDLLITSQLLYLLSYIGRPHRAAWCAVLAIKENDLWNPTVNVRRHSATQPLPDGSPRAKP
jgi:hypothetical protein